MPAGRSVRRRRRLAYCPRALPHRTRELRTPMANPRRDPRPGAPTASTCSARACRSSCRPHSRPAPSRPRWRLFRDRMLGGVRSDACGRPSSWRSSRPDHADREPFFLRVRSGRRTPRVQPGQPPMPRSPQRGVGQCSTPRGSIDSVGRAKSRNVTNAPRDSFRFKVAEQQQPEMRPIRPRTVRPLEPRVVVKPLRQIRRGHAAFDRGLSPSPCQTVMHPWLGVRKRLTLSSGETIEPEHEDQKPIRRAQRAVARSKKRSNRREKRVRHLARLRRRTAVRRRHACHQITSGLIRRFDTIAVEDLRIGNMTRAAKGTTAAPGRNVRAKAGLNRSILEQSWGAILDQLVYKAAWAGRRVVTVRAAFTSQDCSACGKRRTKPDGRERWQCENCHKEHDRDVNAAINIHRAGMRALGSKSSGRAAARAGNTA